MRNFASSIIKVTILSSVVTIISWLAILAVVQFSSSPSSHQQVQVPVQAPVRVPEVQPREPREREQPNPAYIVKVYKINWKTLDPFANVLPALSPVNNFVENSAFVNVVKRRVYYREYVPPVKAHSGQTLLLLHGRSFSSLTWEKLGTLKLMADLGHHVVAVDLPGFGMTGGEQYKGDRGEFLVVLIGSLKLKHPIVVAPSMSGSFAIPFLPMWSILLEGFVSVAATSTNTLTPEQYKILRIPSMNVVGSEDDTGLAQQSTLNLQNLPNLVEVELVGAHHAAYLSQPVMFHTALYNFLMALRNITASH